MWASTASRFSCRNDDRPGKAANEGVDRPPKTPEWPLRFGPALRFDPDKPEQRERVFALVPRFMAWKLATGLVLTAETWLGPERTRSGEEAEMTIGVSRHDRMAVIRRIRHTPALSFGPPEWLAADALDDSYFRLLPRDRTP